MVFCRIWGFSFQNFEYILMHFYKILTNLPGRLTRKNLFLGWEGKKDFAGVKHAANCQVLGWKKSGHKSWYLPRAQYYLPVRPRTQVGSWVVPQIVREVNGISNLSLQTSSEAFSIFFLFNLGLTSWRVNNQAYPTLYFLFVDIYKLTINVHLFTVEEIENWNNFCEIGIP